MNFDARKVTDAFCNMAGVNLNSAERDFLTKLFKSTYEAGYNAKEVIHEREIDALEKSAELYPRSKSYVP